MDELFRPVGDFERSEYEDVADRALIEVSDAELRIAIGTLFGSAQRLVHEGTVDLVILAARRLACLYELLVREGMPALQGCPVVSDRYLEANPGLEPLSQKRCNVLILDDSVVLGTTLFKLTGKIATVIGRESSIRCRTVCIDDEQIAQYMVDGEQVSDRLKTRVDFQSIHHRDSASVQKYSGQIVLALFQKQVPFFADFPITSPLELPRPAWEKLLESDRWYVADVTAPDFDDTASYALALIPRPRLLEEFLMRIVPATAALVDAVKIRLYVQDLAETVRVVVVPIAMMAPATPASLDNVLEELADQLRKQDEALRLDWRGWDPEAKHRLVQLYVSACALAEIWVDISELTPPTELDSSALEPLPLDLYFGDVSDVILAAFNAVVRLYRETPAGFYPAPPRIRIEEPHPAPLLSDDEVQRLLWASQEIVEGTGLPEAPAETQLTKTGLAFSHAVSSIFGFINEKYEMPQRSEIRELGTLKAYLEWLGDGSKRVLNQGLTLRELAVNLAPADSEEGPWSRSLVSLGIDQGNDLGIMVPVTRYDRVRDLVYRCYRIGETAPLASTPLIQLVTSEEPRTDHFIEAMLAGFPIESVKVSISDFLSSRSIRSEPRNYEDLVWRVRGTVPGVPVERYEGAVLGISDGVIAATLINPTEDDPRSARIPLQRIHPMWRRSLRRGSRFTWTAFENKTETSMRRTIEIKVQPGPPIDDAQLTINAATLSASDQRLTELPA